MSLTFGMSECQKNVRCTVQPLVLNAIASLLAPRLLKTVLNGGRRHLYARGLRQWHCSPNSLPGAYLILMLIPVIVYLQPGDTTGQVCKAAGRLPRGKTHRHLLQPAQPAQLLCSSMAQGVCHQLHHRQLLVLLQHACNGTLGLLRTECSPCATARCEPTYATDIQAGEARCCCCQLSKAVRARQPALRYHQLLKVTQACQPLLQPLRGQYAAAAAVAAQCCLAAAAAAAVVAASACVAVP